MIAFIMAGGKGTRISSISSDIPKPMIQVCGKPVLEHQIDCFRKQGITDFVLAIGHLGNIVREYFGDGGRWGVKISYYQEEQPLGTAGAVIAMKEHLQGDFLLLNGDLILDVDFARMLAFHQANHALITLASHPNSHPYDSALLVAERSGRVVQWLSKDEPRTLYKNRVNAGVQILSAKVLAPFTEVKKLDLDKDIIRPLLPTERVYAYDTTEYIKDMGTPERYERVCRDMETGVVWRKNLSQKQRAIFLDRDGVINVHKGFLKWSADMELLPGSAEAIRRINDSGYLALVVTNQPVIARGDCTWEELDEIHRAMETLLGSEGAYVDGIFVCPHHPDRGFPGEIAEYKIECECRKPKPGLLIQAAQQYNVDLEQSYMVGDSVSDIQAGIAAGCKTAYIGSDEEIKRTVCYDSLLAFSEAVLAAK